MEEADRQKAQKARRQGSKKGIDSEPSQQNRREGNGKGLTECGEKRHIQ